MDSLCQNIYGHLLRQEGILALLDPKTLNNQCHLFALKAVQMNSGDDRFVHLMLRLSIPLVSDTALFRAVAEKALKQLELRLDPKEAKAFKKYILDEGRAGEKAARKELVDLFEKDLKESLKIDTPLYRELFRLAHDDLTVESVYTFPKLAGVAYFVDRIAKEQIPIVVKAKVLTKEGTAGVIVVPSREIKDDEPVFVLEGFATDGTRNLHQCRKEAQSCPSYFHRLFDARTHHDLKNPCFYCKKAEQINLTPYRERIEKAMESPDKMLYALGADFVIKEQPKFQRFFEDTERYPRLSALFSESVPLIEKLGVGMDNPTTFSACHMYADVGCRGKSLEFQLDMTHEQFLRSRGLL